MNKIDTIQCIKYDIFKIKIFNLIKFNSETKYHNETIQDTKDNKFDQTITSIDS